MKHARKNVAVYECLEDYVQAISEKVSPNIKLDNVQSLFLNFGGFLAIVSFVSVVHLVLFKQIRTIYRKLLVGLVGLVAHAQEILGDLPGETVITIKPDNPEDGFKPDDELP